MSELHNPVSEITPPVRKRRGFKLTDALILLVLLVLVVFLVRTLVTQLGIRHDVSAARNVTNQLIGDMQKQDGAAALKLGDKNFQAVHSGPQLTGLFKQAEPYIKGTPVITKQTLTKGSAAKVVSVYYKFGSNKPFYVRVTASEQNGAPQWHIINYAGNANLSALTK
jgi:Tfp pilus assembly protein PilX